MSKTGYLHCGPHEIVELWSSLHAEHLLGTVVRREAAPTTVVDLLAHDALPPYETSPNLVDAVASVPALHDGVPRCVALAMSAHKLAIFAGRGAQHSHRVAFDPLAERCQDAAAPGVTVNPALITDVSELFAAAAAAHAIKAFVDRCLRAYDTRR